MFPNPTRFSCFFCFKMIFQLCVYVRVSLSLAWTWPGCQATCLSTRSVILRVRSTTMSIIMMRQSWWLGSYGCMSYRGMTNDTCVKVNSGNPIIHGNSVSLQQALYQLTHATPDDLKLRQALVQSNKLTNMCYSPVKQEGECCKM